MIKAIFFDLDDTLLIDALKQHLKANQKVFSYFGIDYEEVKKRTKDQDFLGKRVNDILQIMRDAVEISEEILPIKTLMSKREEFFLELVKNEA